MYEISLMSQSDLKEAYEIEKTTNPTPWSKENFFSSFEVGHKSLACKYNKRIVGFIIFSHIKKESHLLSIAVEKDHQRSGAGSILLKTMINQSKVLGAKKIYLEVRSKNKVAINFVIKGNQTDGSKFIKDAIRTNYYSGDSPDDAVLMSLDI